MRLLLQRLADVQHDQFPFAYGGIPTQHPLLNLLCEVQTLTTLVVGHHTAQLCHRALLLVLHLDGERYDAASLHLVAGKEGLRCGILHRYVRAAKGPSRAVVHRHLDADTLTLFDGVLQHLHPAFTQVGNVVLIVALHSVDGGNLDPAQTGFGILLEVVCQVGLIDGTAQPPPAGTGECLGLNGRPLLGLRAAAQKQQTDNQ